MKDDLQKEAIDCAISAFEKYNVEKDVAEHIKKEFDKKHGPTWHCIVGRNFGKPITPISKYCSITISEGILFISNELDDLLEKKNKIFESIYIGLAAKMLKF
ncbi:hypothetical protein GIB67_017930 [Kingdonia uniflora]|uniref:Dynein light chain n=1 Tax=Kingdonia uniflora TaxID=39325 RepID=A0A7J7NEZ9_9MAGN|nr:hypothetical protein GIB67_017930 [Kingdonia uniflora]